MDNTTDARKLFFSLCINKWSDLEIYGQQVVQKRVGDSIGFMMCFATREKAEEYASKNGVSVMECEMTFKDAADIWWEDGRASK